MFNELMRLYWISFFIILRLRSSKKRIFGSPFSQAQSPTTNSRRLEKTPSKTSIHNQLCILVMVSIYTNDLYFLGHFPTENWSSSSPHIMSASSTISKYGVDVPTVGNTRNMSYYMITHDECLYWLFLFLYHNFLKLIFRQESTKARPWSSKRSKTKPTSEKGSSFANYYRVHSLIFPCYISAWQVQDFVSTWRNWCIEV